MNFFDAATTCDSLFGFTTRLDSLRALLTSLSCVTWMLGTVPPGSQRGRGRAGAATSARRDSRRASAPATTAAAKNAAEIAHSKEPLWWSGSTLKTASIQSGTASVTSARIALTSAKTLSTQKRPRTGAVARAARRTDVVRRSNELIPLIGIPLFVAEARSSHSARHGSMPLQGNHSFEGAITSVASQETREPLDDKRQPSGLGRDIGARS